MFRTGQPEAAGGALCVSRAEHRVFDGISDLATDPAMRAYLFDMVRPYGLALRDDLLDSGAGHSYGEMAEPLIEAILPDGAPVDLLVLVYGIHDIRLGRATATYLSSRCPGDPLSFAVCDQGVAAAFTALRMIGAYAATGRCERALLIVVEQAALHYELAAPAPIPERHAAVAVLFEESVGPESLRVRQHAGVAPDQVGARMRSDVAELSGARPDLTVIIGNGLAAARESIVDDVLRASKGQPYTGVWWELSAGLAGWQARDRLVLLADYDAALGYLCTAAMRVGTRSAVHSGLTEGRR
jgi:4-hydroxymandelate oxidase